MQRCCDDYVLYAVPESIRWFLPQRRRHSIVVTIMYLCGTLGHAWKTAPDSIQVLALLLVAV